MKNPPGRDIIRTAADEKASAARESVDSLDDFRKGAAADGEAHVAASELDLPVAFPRSAARAGRSDDSVAPRPEGEGGYRRLLGGIARDRHLVDPMARDQLV